MREIERTPRAGEAGFTIVEGLIAALILAIILIGILPMITRSMQNNLQGNDSSNQTNAALDSLEQLYSLPFNSPAVTVPAGSTELNVVDYYRLETNTWETTAATFPNHDQYIRSYKVEQFSSSDLEDGKLDTPLDGDADVIAVQIKRITIEIQTQRLLGASPYRIVLFKAS